MGDGLARQQPARDGQRLLEAVDPNPRPVVRHPELTIIGPHPAGTQAELESAAGQELQRGSLACHEQRVAIVVGQHEGPQVQARRGRGGGGEGGHRRQLIGQVVRHHQRRVAQRLRPARQRGPLRGIRGHRCGDAEAEVVHGVTVP